ncbi:hypothetical protein D3C75_1319090 [compost metagenome]
MGVQLVAVVCLVAGIIFGEGKKFVKGVHGALQFLDLLGEYANSRLVIGLQNGKLLLALGAKLA